LARDGGGAMKRARIYKKAIELMEGMGARGHINSREGYACNAIEAAQGHLFNRSMSSAARVFYDVFKPEYIPRDEAFNGFFGVMCPRATHERIVALGFMLAMVEAGDA
jgi:hypothetical protein